MCMCVLCVCVCVCVCVCFVRVLLSNEYHIKRCFSNFSHHCPHQINCVVVETFMTISSTNVKSGTNGILPCRTKHSITLDLQKQMV